MKGKLLDPNLSPAEREAAILAMQPASTRATLMRSNAEQAAWLSRPLDLSCQLATKPEEMEKFERRISPDEYAQVEATRRRPKNSAGQSDESSVSKERREAGISAFTCSPPAELTPEQRQKLTTLVPIPPPPMLPAKETKTHWVWGYVALLPKFWKYR